MEKSYRCDVLQAVFRILSIVWPKSRWYGEESLADKTILLWSYWIFGSDDPALAARGYLEEQLAAQQALVSASQDAYHLAQMRFRGGVEDFLSELDAQRSLYDARQQLQIARLQRFENLVTLYKTLGGGLHENTAFKLPVAG